MKKARSGIVNHSNQFIKAKENGGELSHPSKGKKMPQCSHPHSEEMKKQLSKSRKKFLKNNPEKHPWKLHDRFKSKPCETLKKKLRKAGYKFEEEFMPLFPQRHFAIDIAFPEKKIGIEVNGEQHYNRDGKLTDYYRKRNLLMEQHGWNIIELHYKKVYRDDIIKEILGG